MVTGISYSRQRKLRSNLEAFSFCLCLSLVPVDFFLLRTVKKWGGSCQQRMIMNKTKYCLCNFYVIKKKYQKWIVKLFINFSFQYQFINYNKQKVVHQLFYKLNHDLFFSFSLRSYLAVFYMLLFLHDSPQYLNLSRPLNQIFKSLTWCYPYH